MEALHEILRQVADLEVIPGNREPLHENHTKELSLEEGSMVPVSLGGCGDMEGDTTPRRSYLHSASRCRHSYFSCTSPTVRSGCSQWISSDLTCFRRSP